MGEKRCFSDEANRSQIGSRTFGERARLHSFIRVKFVDGTPESIQFVRALGKNFDQR